MRYLKYSLTTLVAIVVWVLLAAYGGLYGWWMSPVVKAGDHAGFFAWAERRLTTENEGNVAFVLIENGEVVAQHYGKESNAVDEDTLFPTASLSKWIASLAVMTLVEQGKLDLDASAQSYMTRWKLPDSDFDNDAVTIRRLLSHTAGLTDNLGFGDYRADETVPTLLESLQNPRASDADNVVIRVGNPPGEQFQYSGGGYLILELIVEEVTGKTLAEYVKEAILEPLDMQRSTYAFLGDMPNASSSFDSEGNPAPSYRYVSASAVGFASTAADLTKLATALVDNSGKPISLEMLNAARQPEAFVMGAGIWGLGPMLYAETPGGEHVFGHDGANDPAINTTVRINPETGDAIILLVNGHKLLATSIGAEWVLWQTGNPDFLVTEKALQSAVLPALLGSGLIVLVCLVIFKRRAR